MGKQEVLELLTSMLPAFNDVEIELRLADGDYVVILWQAHVVWGALPVCSVFRIGDGLIQEVRGFFDPRPIGPLGARYLRRIGYCDRKADTGEEAADWIRPSDHEAMAGAGCRRASVSVPG